MSRIVAAILVTNAGALHPTPSTRMPRMTALLVASAAALAPPSTPQARRTLHVLIPDGRPLWAAGEQLPTQQILAHCQPIVKVVRGWRGTPIFARSDWWQAQAHPVALPAPVCELLDIIEHFTGTMPDAASASIWRASASWSVRIETSG